MFDILKKKITGLVENITKNIIGEKKQEDQIKQEIREIKEIEEVPVLKEVEKKKEEKKEIEMHEMIEEKKEQMQVIQENKTKENQIIKEDKIRKKEERNEKIKEKKQPEIKEMGEKKEDTYYQEDSNLSHHKEAEIKEDKKEENKKEEVIQAVPETIEKRVNKKEVEKPEIRVKTSLFTKVKSLIIPEVTIKEEDVASALDDFELQLLTADVALPVAEEIITDLKKRIVGQKIKSSDIEKYIISSIHDAVYDVMQKENIDLVAEIKKTRQTKKPYKILFIGPNGAGKTTTIAKVAHYLKKNGFSCVISASDTFRAAAIEQAVEHAKRLNIPYIKHEYGSDPAAVAFDAIKYAEAHDIDVVLIDSAGRQETNRNLIEQLKKIERVTSPNLKVFVGEGIAGNALLTQVSEFNSAIKLDAVILTKLDVDAKGGTVISVRKATGVPILFIGVGQEYDDLIPFDKEYIVKRIMNN
jgi:fused signal recognition particle receptor